MANKTLEIINQHLQRQEHTVVAWLYGSRATHSFTAASDYDIAVALTENSIGSFELVDQIRYELASLVAEPVSVVDINRAPIPLAYNIISMGTVLACKSDLRLRREEQRVWALWEDYKYEHERYRQAL